MLSFQRVGRKPSITPDTVLLHRSGSDEAPSKVTRGPLSAVQVRPVSKEKAGPVLSSTLQSKVTLTQVAIGVYHWATCVFMVVLVCSQLMGAIQDTHTSTGHLIYGRDPDLGPAEIIGSNDVPYPDRVIACVRNGKTYEPKVLSSLLAAPGTSAILEDSTGTAVHGYRLKKRRNGSISDALDPMAQVNYEISCELIANTIDNILDACLALGYTDLVRDNLHVIDDWDSKDLYKLTDTLPILIMPYWDNGPKARHAIPTKGGDACIFRLENAYSGTGLSTIASLRAVNQSVRHDKTIHWLNRPGGVWRNGWYEDPEGMKWYSDVTSSAKGAPYYMRHRVFDIQTGQELDCSGTNMCEAATYFEGWGDKLASGYQAYDYSSVYIANATEFGFFIYESYELRIVRSVFDWETLLSNVYSGIILSQWAIAQALMLMSAYRGKTHWFGGGISCVSGSESFSMLLVASLPRLRMTLTAFWTVGCKFEGQQSALAEAWFVMYPAIVHFILIYFSILNLLAKALRRRVSDALFTPSVVVFCLLHYFRIELARSGWLSGIDGRIRTLIFSEEAQQLQLIDFFTTDLAWRMNGRVTLIFAIKLCILGLNLVPLLLARPLPVPEHRADRELQGAEKALALRMSEVGGLGSSLPYMVAMVDVKHRRLSSIGSIKSLPAGAGDNPTNIFEKPSAISPVVAFLAQDAEDQKSSNNYSQQQLQQQQVLLVSSQELTRLGYLVVGDKYLTTVEEWSQLTAMAPLQALWHLWNHRVLLWVLRPPTSTNKVDIANGRALESTEPQMWRLDDPRLKNIHCWQVSACNIEC